MSADSPAERLLAVVSALVAETHPGRQSRVGLHSHLERELGLDSLARAELLLRVGQAFGVVLPDEALSEAQTPEDLLGFLARASATPIAPAGPAPAARQAAVELPVAAATFVEAFEWHASRHPERLQVLLYGEAGEPEAISYGALHADARAVAAGLIERGLEPRETVALMLPTGRAYLAGFLGVMLAGGIPVPIYPPARLSQIEEHIRRHARILDNARAAIMITVPQARTVAVLLRGAVPSLRAILTPEELRGAPVELAWRAAPEDIAFLQYTSGSTGDPKGVILTHANLMANIRAMAEAAAVTTQDVAVSWLPLYHDMGLIGMWLTPIYCGCAVVLMSPLAFLSRPARWLQVLSRHRGTISAAPNFAFDLVARRVAEAELEGLDLSSWRLALNGAEPVSAATLEAFAARLAPAGFRRGALFPAYGLAECCVGLAFPPLGRGPAVDTISRRVLAEERRAAPVPANDPQALPVVACGRAIPGHALRVVDALGQELPDGQVGRLQFRGPSATPGYYRNPEATRRLLAGEWRETGDYAYIVDGEVRLTGREKDLIIRGGRNLYPYELEQAVGALEGVRRGCVAVFASADARGGTERLVVLAETREEDEAARERLRLRINELAADVVGLPADEVVLAPPHTVLKTSSGKIRRSACRELYEQGLVGASQPRHSVWWAMARLGLRAGVQRLRFFARGAAARAYGGYVWALFLAIAVPLWCAVAAVGRPAFGRRAGHLAARLILRLAGLPWRAEHLDRLPARTHVLAVNHASYVDAIYLTAALPPESGYCFIAKREFAGHWLPRLFFRGIGALFVERFDVRRGVEDVDTLAAALAAGRNLVIFPEGTFSRETGLRAFRTGAFAAAARADVPVVAAGLRGVRAVLRDGTWLPRRGPVDFEIGPVLPPGGEDWAGVVRLRDAARAEILRLCGEPDIAGAGLPFAPPGPGGPA